MSKNLSKLDKNDESSLNELFEAAVAGNHEESARLLAGVNDDEIVEQVTDPVDEQDQVGDPEEEEASGTTDEVDDKDDKTVQVPPVATDEIAQLKSELHRLRSDAGRVPFLQRRQAELERQLAEASRISAVSTPRDGSTAASPDVKLPAHLQTKIDKMRELDPDNADLMEEIYRNAVAQSRTDTDVQFRQVDEVRRKSEEESFAQEQYRLLTEVAPDAPSIFRTPEWAEWKNKLTPAFRAMAESAHANEVFQAVNAFKVDYPKYGVQTPAAPAATTSTAPAVDTTTQARQAKLTQSASVKTPVAKQGEQLDIEALFAEAYNSSLPQNLQRR